MVNTSTSLVLPSGAHEQLILGLSGFPAAQDGNRFGVELESSA